jgi:hypothetical protein
MTSATRIIQALGLGLLLGASGIACGGLDGAEGGEGQPCLTGGVCNAGLVCNAANICERAAASGFSALYQSASFQQCSGCHAPGAPGFQTGVEATQDWSSRDNAYASLQGNASGLVGNFEGCNGVPLLGDSPANSLLVAVFDETIRAAFSLPAFPDCTADAISDMTLKIGGALSTQELTLLKDWITAGAPDN